MTWSDFYLLCFGIGTLWSIVALLLGGLHVGHIGAHSAHSAPAPVHTHVHGVPLKTVTPKTASAGFEAGILSWAGSMINPSCAAVYLAWFGGIGYLLTRHSGLAFWIDLVIAVALGLTGAWLLASFIRFLQAREHPLDPADYQVIGVLGRVSSAIRPGGVGELIYTRDGARCSLPASSDDGVHIPSGEEVVVTRYENGIAYVRTWEAMTQPGTLTARPHPLPKETKHVE